MKHESDYINIEIANGGFILSYTELTTTPDGVTTSREIREVSANQRKLINRLKELIAEKSLVAAE